MNQKSLNQLLAKVATDSRLGVIITDNKGYTIWVNKFIRTMTGYTLEDFKGKPPGQILQGPETNPIHIDRIREGLKSGKSFETEILNYTKKGSKFWVNLQIDPVRNMRNEIEYFLSVQHDITDLMEKNEQLENFNYLTTHDLINQVGNLYNLISMLSQDGLSEDQKKKIEIISLTALKLKNTTRDLRKLLSFQGNTKELSFEEINLFDLINEVSQTLERDLEQRSVTCKIKVDKNLKIRSSRLILTSLCYNLMSNGIKYSDPKKVSFLHVEAQIKVDKVVIDFVDNGLGMDLKNKREKLFKAFKTFHNNADAIGIGLYLTKKQLDALGGSINVESTVKEGSTFSVTLPFE